MQAINSLYNFLVSIINTNLIAIGGVFLLFVVLGFVGFVNKKLQALLSKKLESILSKFKETFIGGISPDAIDKIHQIQIELAELRVKLNASRCFIVEIHNGDKFASGEHIWKMSVSYENVRKGVSYIGKDWQDILASLVWNDFTRTLFPNTRYPLPSGIEHIQENFRVCKGNCSTTQTCLLISTADMSFDNGPIRSILEDFGVSHMLYAPIYLDGNLLGYVAAHYDNANDFIQTYNSGLWQPCLLCRFSSHIATVWNGDLSQKSKMLNYQKRLLAK